MIRPTSAIIDLRRSMDDQDRSGVHPADRLPAIPVPVRILPCQRQRIVKYEFRRLKTDAVITLVL
jgi:hypothetical protein